MIPKTASEITDWVIENEKYGTWRERIEAAIYLDRAVREGDLK